MRENISYNLAKLAFENKTLDKLFLGIEPYNYIPKFSSASGNIDLTAVIPDGIFVYIKENESPENIFYLKETLNYLCSQYAGLDVVATYILCAIIYKNRHGQLPTEVDINELSDKLKASIWYFKDKLKNDFTDYGFGCQEGRYGDLKRLSKITTEKEGINFFPEDRQDKGIKI